MKKLFYFAAAAVALAACAKNEVVPVNSGENQEITFNVAPKTKAVTKFADNLKFKSYAYYLPGKETWDNHTTDPALYINGAEIAYRKKTEESEEKVWKAGDSYYWPKNGKLTFFAWTSLNETNANNATPSYETSYVTDVKCSVADGINVTGYDVTTNKNVDFLVADIVKDQTSNSAMKYWNAGVTTIFKHKLSYVIFKVKTDIAYSNKTFTLKSITFKDIEYVGDYKQLGTEGWTPKTPEVKTPVVYTNASTPINNSEATLTTDNTFNYYLPQSFATSGSVVVEYWIETNENGNKSTDKVTKTINMKDLFTSWDMGKKYTVTLTFKLDEILWDPAVEDWTTADGTVSSDVK